MDNELERMVAPVAIVDEETVDAELAWHLLDEHGDRAAPALPGWQIENVGQADWAMRKVAELRQIEQGYRDEIDRWTDALRRARRASEWFTERLQQWGMRERGARASFVLAHGTVATRKSNARIVVVSDDDAIGWARTHCPAAIKTTESFLVSKLDGTVQIVRGPDDDWRVVDANGELVPGLGVLPEHVTASVQPDLA